MALFSRRWDQRIDLRSVNVDPPVAILTLSAGKAAEDYLAVWTATTLVIATSAKTGESPSVDPCGRTVVQRV